MLMKSAKPFLVVTALVVVGAAALLVLKHQSQAALAEQNAALQQQLAQLQLDDASLSNRLALAVAPAGGSAAEHAELIQLRGEVGLLRRQAAESARLLAENQNRPAPVAPANPAQTPEVSPDDLFQVKSFHTINALKQVGLAMRIFAGDNNDQYPTNFNQILNVLGTTNFPGNISLDALELVNIGVANEKFPQMIASRERVPRQKPDGSWERIYLLADGSVQTQTSQDGNFDAYEKQQQQASLPPGP